MGLQRGGLRRAGASVVVGSLIAASFLISAKPARAADDPATGSGQARPNILVIFGDDIGQANISAFTKGLMGYRTPNIDRLAKEGLTFTDYYAEQSCTAGRSTFITGQTVFRTGPSKVGMPAAPVGLHRDDPSVGGARLSVQVHHTDAEREWAYDRASGIGRLDKGLDEAKAKGWTLVDMKTDWKRVFVFENQGGR